jgi:hypothetical protein
MGNQSIIAGAHVNAESVVVAVNPPSLRIEMSGLPGGLRLQSPAFYQPKRLPARRPNGSHSFSQHQVTND